MLTLLMVIGAGMIFFLKGVFEVRTTGDEFRFIHFLAKNSNRLALLALGLVLSSLGMYLDPAGLESLFATLPVSIKVASPLVMGAALSGLVLVIPTAKVATVPMEEETE